MIFRVYGNDFAVITREHINMESWALNSFTSIRRVEIDADLQHVDLVREKMYTLKKGDKVMILPSK
jgi:hypothetical protein